MSEILKAEGIVLKRLDHGDSSRIISLFTKEYGKFSGVVKGAKSPKSKIGAILDTINQVSIVFYNKEHRDIQLITQAELLNHFSRAKSNFESLTYSSAVVELVEKLLLEHEKNDRLYRGTVKILELLNTDKDQTSYNFAKYMLFFIEEAGYQLPLNECISCKDELKSVSKVYLNYNAGFYCEKCGLTHNYFEEISKELFNLIFCLNSKNCEIENLNPKLINRAIKVFERFLMFHNPDFKGLKTLRLF